MTFFFFVTCLYVVYNPETALPIFSKFNVLKAYFIPQLIENENGTDCLSVKISSR